MQKYYIWKQFELLVDNYSCLISLKVELALCLPRKPSDSHIIARLHEVPTVNYNYFAFQVSLWLSNTLILLQLTSPGLQTTGINSPKWTYELLAVLRAISFIYCLSIVCGSVALTFPELSLEWPTQHFDEKHGPHHQRGSCHCIFAK